MEFELGCGGDEGDMEDFGGHAEVTVSCCSICLSIQSMAVVTYP